MKAYKCIKCGYLNKITGLYGASLKICPVCGCDFTQHLRIKVELIDWEKELLG